MARCPNCNAEMGQTDVQCSACGYDFPATPSPPDVNRGLIYSPLANFALFIGSLVAGLCCIAAFFGVFTNLITGNFLNAFVLCPVAFFLSLAMLVVFIRSADQGNSR